MNTAPIESIRAQIAEIDHAMEFVRVDSISRAPLLQQERDRLAAMAAEIEQSEQYRKEQAAATARAEAVKPMIEAFRERAQDVVQPLDAAGEAIGAALNAIGSLNADYAAISREAGAAGVPMPPLAHIIGAETDARIMRLNYAGQMLRKGL